MSAPQVKTRFAPHEVLSESMRRARVLAEKTSVLKARALLRKAQLDLEKRIAKSVPGSFDAVRARATLKQVRFVVQRLQLGLKGLVLEQADQAGVQAAKDVAGYLKAAQRVYGEAAKPLGLDEAALSDQAVQGANTSAIRRVISDPEHPGRPGALERYGEATVGHFEKVFQLARVSGASYDEVRQQLVDASPFLQDKPAYWAERLARTESMSSSNAGNLSAIKNAHDQLGDVLKILNCPYDSRTGSDSIAIHGQIRRVNEDFDTWFGPCPAPPDRPNDRASVVPHRLSWGPPANLKPYDMGAVLARWQQEKRKGSPPSRLLMSTVPASAFRR